MYTSLCDDDCRDDRSFIADGGNDSTSASFIPSDQDSEETPSIVTWETRLPGNKRRTYSPMSESRAPHSVMSQFDDAVLDQRLERFDFGGLFKIGTIR